MPSPAGRTQRLDTGTFPYSSDISFPDFASHMPTWNEFGYKGQSFETFQCLVAPAKTPPDIVKQLEKASLEILVRLR